MPAVPPDVRPLVSPRDGIPVVVSSRSDIPVVSVVAVAVAFSIYRVSISSRLVTHP